MRTKMTTPLLALTIVSLVAGFALVSIQAAVAGDARIQRSMTDPRAAGSALNFAKQPVTNPPPEKAKPPRQPGIQSGDQIQFVYDGRSGYNFGRLTEVRKAGPPSEAATTATTHDHRGKTASKPPSLPPGSPPPAAPAAALPPAGPPGTTSTPQTSGGNVVRNHVDSANGNGETGRYVVHDRREGYGGDTYDVRYFRTATGARVETKPRQKPPCYGDACWLSR
jgi:hypothetical protein